MALMFLTAPAKTMNLALDWKAMQTTQPRLLNKTTKIISQLQALDVATLKQVLQVSDALAEENFARYAQWRKNHTIDTAKPAILTYFGAIFKEMNPGQYNAKEQEYAQNYLRILSGLYGMLRAYDLMQPYRLEMKTVLEFAGKKPLDAFWREDVTELFVKDCKTTSAQAVVNLASHEYFKVIDERIVPLPVIHVDFKERKNGQLRTVAIYAKKARGAMMEFAVKNHIRDIDDLKRFKNLGYMFESSERNRLLFTRSLS